MSIRFTYTVSFVLVGIASAISIADDPNAAPRTSAKNSRLTVEEARGRAELLHETFHAVLQAVHHQYYREDEGLTIPAVTLKKVFHELAVRKSVEVRWLAVNATAMNSDHVARNDFERRAVDAIASGKIAYEATESDAYVRAGAVTLTSECLKCHLPNRTSTESRAAALVIRIPTERR